MKLTPDARRALDALPPKRRAFVLAYCGEAAGNATEAARNAGYAHPMEEGYRLLRKAQVMQAIEALRVPAESKAIASVEEMREWFSAVMRGEVSEQGTDSDGFPVDKPASLRDRLRAAELLGKTQAAFVERREVKDVTPPKSVEEASERIEALRGKLRRVG